MLVKINVSRINKQTKITIESEVYSSDTLTSITNESVAISIELRAALKHFKNESISIETNSIAFYRDFTKVERSKLFEYLDYRIKRYRIDIQKIKHKKEHTNHERKIR